ncbi:MAG: hypothetical protein ABJ251_22965 [Paracoccaceae bacterium]
MKPDPDLPCDATPVRAQVFEDTLDGYIPLELSIQYMLDRNGFQAAWIVLMHAPVMDIPGLAASAPVPVTLDTSCSGLIDSMDMIATRGNDGTQMSGVGSWRWNAAERAHETEFAQTHRLGEPVFIRGIGFECAETPSIVSLSFGPMTIADAQTSAVAFVRCAPCDLDAQLHALGWVRAAIWSMGEYEGSGICADHAFRAPAARFADIYLRDDANGLTPNAPSSLALCDYILVDLTGTVPNLDALACSTLR